jgi:hypothetical protein
VQLIRYGAAAIDALSRDPARFYPGENSGLETVRV